MNLRSRSSYKPNSRMLSFRIAHDGLIFLYVTHSRILDVWLSLLSFWIVAWIISMCHYHMAYMVNMPLNATYIHVSELFGCKILNCLRSYFQRCYCNQFEIWISLQFYYLPNFLPSTCLTFWFHLIIVLIKHLVNFSLLISDSLSKARFQISDTMSIERFINNYKFPLFCCIVSIRKMKQLFE